MMPSSVLPSKMNVSFLGLPLDVVPFISYSAANVSTAGSLTSISGLGSLFSVEQALSPSTKADTDRILINLFFIDFPSVKLIISHKGI